MYLNGATDDLYQKIAQKLKLIFSIRSIRLTTVLHICTLVGAYKLQSLACSVLIRIYMLM